MNNIKSLTSFIEFNKHRGIPDAQIVQRYAQFVVLRCIASDATLKKRLVLKGGNALDLMYSGDRSTKDIDFSDAGSFSTEWFQRNFDRVLRVVAPEFGMFMKLQKCERQPKGEERTCATWEMTIGYAHVERNRRLYERSQSGNCARGLPLIVKLDVSENEFIGESEEKGIQGLNVSTLNDIVAEKLRAILQQVNRNRSRAQDVYDIAKLWGDPLGRQQLDPEKILQFHLKKCQIRGVSTGTQQFHEPEVFQRAQKDYGGLKETVRNLEEFIEFDEAWGMVLELIEWIGLKEKY